MRLTQTEGRSGVATLARFTDDTGKHYAAGIGLLANRTVAVGFSPEDFLLTFRIPQFITELEDGETPEDALARLLAEEGFEVEE